jgi:hypothetical protein
MPSTPPALPGDPARVVTAPSGVTLRIVWLPQSLHGLHAFDVALGLAGTSAVEGRSGGSAGDHTIIVRFNHQLAAATAALGGGGGAVAGEPKIVDGEVWVNLTGISDMQTLTLTLSGVVDQVGQSLRAVEVTAGFLRGDVNGDGHVNAGDALLTRSRSGQATNIDNFRADVNSDGTINAGDAAIVRGNSGQAITAPDSEVEEKQ